jgi:hypothetical protein
MAVVVAIAGVLFVAAAFSGSSEARPFAVPGSLACIANSAPRPTPIPTQDITPENLSEFSRLINAWQNEKDRLSTDHFIAERISMLAAARAESNADRFLLPTFDETVAAAERVVTGKVLEQRLEWRRTTGRQHPVLVSQLDADHSRVSQELRVSCGDTPILVHYSWEPPLAAGGTYALVVDDADHVLLAYELAGDRLTPLYPADDSPIGADSMLSDLVDAIEN